MVSGLDAGAVTTAAIWGAAYYAWTLLFFKVVDPLLRRLFGGWVWAFDARQFWERGRYRRWHWAPPTVDDGAVSVREFGVDMAGVIIVNVVAGALPVGTLFLPFIPPMAMYMGLFVAIAIYGVFWSGRYEALREAADQPISGRSSPI